MNLKKRGATVLTGLIITITYGSVITLALTSQVSYAAPQIPMMVAAGNCESNDFFGLKPWYAYIGLTEVKDDQQNFKGCTVDLQLSNGNGVKDLNKIWLIVMAVFEDLMRIATVVAVAFVIFGGFRYITSQGEPENIKAALNTIVSALIGLVIAIVSATVIGFIAQALGT